MASDTNEPEFNRNRAELFEALGHPTRIQILQALNQRPMGFAELKKATGIESSGHLTFHLGKLEGLLKVGQDGSYSLTDDGREALRVVSATRDDGGGRIKMSGERPTLRNVVLVAALVALVLFASFAVYQQQQIGSLNHQLSQEQTSSILINGTRYSYVEIPLGSLTLPATFELNGVAFNLTASPIGGAGVTFSVVGTVESNITLSPQLGTGTPVTIRIAPVPSIQVKFADGQSESYNLVNSTRNQFGTIQINFQPTVNPWFTHHANPRAGVYWNLTADSFVFYVSMGS